MKEERGDTEAPERQLRDLADKLRKELAGGPRREQDIREPTWLQWAGLRLAYVVLGLMAAFIVGPLVFGAVSMPRLADFGSPATQDSFNLWRQAAEMVFQQVTALIDQVVVRALLPVLTLILGYVFGSQARPGGGPSEQQ